VQSTSGNLDATDVDSSNTFVVQTAVAGSNGYGTFSIDDTGAWTYTMDSAHDEFVGGTDYTDSITVAHRRRHHPGAHRHPARHQRRGDHHRQQHRRTDRDQRRAEHQRQPRRHRRG
jgi:VCBS repeat-containing protein